MDSQIIDPMSDSSIKLWGANPVLVNAWRNRVSDVNNFLMHFSPLGLKRGPWSQEEMDSFRDRLIIFNDDNTPLHV